MNTSPWRKAIALGLAACTAFACVSVARAEQPPSKPTTGKPVVNVAKKPAITKPVADDPAALNNKFWGDWNETKSSDGFAKLNAAVSCADKSTAALDARKPDEPQSVVNLAISKPEEAAKVMTDATAASTIVLAPMRLRPLSTW